MTLQNRVLATGEIVADPARGLFTGNRGILHDAAQRLGRARWRHKAWIICTLDYNGVRREVMSPGTWTELFFLDEAVALAAGQRPCALCRRAAWRAYIGAARHHGPTPALDARLHGERIDPATRRQRRHEAEISALPDGAIILNEAPMLVLGDGLLPISPSGYDAAVPRPGSGRVTLLTPPTSVAALQAGYRPILHPSAVA